MNLNHVMTTSPSTIAADATVAQAIEMLHDLDVRHLPVVQGDELVGMLSDRDLRGLSLATTGGDEAQVAAGRYLERTVADVMVGDVVTLDSSDDVAEAIDMLLEHRVGAVPVVDRFGSLVGIVSYVDLLRAGRDYV